MASIYAGTPLTTTHAPVRWRPPLRAALRRAGRALRTLLTHTLFLPQVLIALPVLALLRLLDGAP